MSWARLRGHAIPLQQVRTAYEQGRLAHAYLLVGPDGVGKRTFALEVAKSLLCEQPPEVFQPCDQCPSCLQVEAETHPDVTYARVRDDKLELPVKLMREVFIPRLGLKATRGGWKLGLVEDADAFNEESANCFLKTLEEPPARTLLLLRSRTLERQLPTIRSRCQVLRFNPLSESDLLAVLAEHGLTEPRQVAKLIPLSGGSPGLALALNDNSLWETRQRLLRNLLSPRPDPIELASDWKAAVEAAGKESRDQRQRCSLLVRLLLDGLRQRLYEAAQNGEPLEPWLHRLELCAETDLYIERRVNLITLVDAMADQLCKTVS